MGSPTGRVSHHQPGLGLALPPSGLGRKDQPANYDAYGSPSGQGQPRRGRQLSGQSVSRFGSCRTRLFNEVADLGVLPPPPYHPRRNRIAPLSKMVRDNLAPGEGLSILPFSRPIGQVFFRTIYQLFQVHFPMASNQRHRTPRKATMTATTIQWFTPRSWGTVTFPRLSQERRVPLKRG